MKIVDGYTHFCNMGIGFIGEDDKYYSFKNIFEYLDYVSRAKDVYFKDVTKEVQTLCNISSEVNKSISSMFSCKKKTIKLGNCTRPDSKFLKLFEPLFVLAIKQDEFSIVVATRDLDLLVKYINKKFLIG